MARSFLVVVLAALGFGLLAEALCRVLPVSTSTRTGYYIDPNILTYPPHFEWRVSTGWDLRNPQSLRSNNLGFAAARDFVPDANAVALIGDSFVESSMLPAAARPGAQLEAALGGSRPVYAMGSPGTSLLDYAERVRLARERLKVRDIVILLEYGDVLQSLCGSGNVHAACLDPASLAPRTERLPEAGAVKRMLRHSAFAQYLVGQLRLDPAGSLQAARASLVRVGKPAASPAGAGRAGVDKNVAAAAVVKAFFERVGKTAGTGRLVLLMDGRHTGLDQPLEEAAAAARRWFAETAQQHGAIVVDAEQAYAEHYRRSQRSLNVGPYDKHLNTLGVGAAMRAAAAALL